MQHRVERPWTDLVAVLAQLLEHPIAKELAFGGMVQNVQANKPAEEILMLCRNHGQEPDNRST